MPVGGKRPGAGRPKGSPNKATAARQAEIEATGLTPLEYMLSILRDETKAEAVRLDAAKSAAPYVHPRLSAIDATLSGDVGLKVEIVRFGDAPAS